MASYWDMCGLKGVYMRQCFASNCPRACPMTMMMTTEEEEEEDGEDYDYELQIE
jgi:hypothetical protein